MISFMWMDFVAKEATGILVAREQQLGQKGSRILCGWIASPRKPLEFRTAASKQTVGRERLGAKERFILSAVLSKQDHIRSSYFYCRSEY